MSGETADANATGDIKTIGETNIPECDFTFTRFGTEYDVHAGFLPFERRPRDRFEDVTKLTEFFTSRPPYTQGTSMKNLSGRAILEDDFNRQADDDFELLALFHGWWCYGHTRASGRQFASPEYTHRDSQEYVTDWGDREELARDAASLGHVTPAQVGLAFGYYPDEDEDLSDDEERAYIRERFFDAVDELGLPWEELRAEGVEWMDRTWKTLFAWDYSHAEIADAFAVSVDDVSQAIQRVEDYDPVDDPTQDGDDDA